MGDRPPSRVLSFRFILELKQCHFIVSGFCHPPSNTPDSFISLLLIDKTTVVSCEFIVLSPSVHYHGLHLQCPESACTFIVESRQKNLHYAEEVTWALTPIYKFVSKVHLRLQFACLKVSFLIPYDCDIYYASYRYC